MLTSTYLSDAQQQCDIDIDIGCTWGVRSLRGLHGPTLSGDLTIPSLDRVESSAELHVKWLRTSEVDFQSLQTTAGPHIIVALKRLEWVLEGQQMYPAD